MLSNYRKLAAALIGVGLMIGARYGLDLGPHAAALTDGLTALLTLAGVYFARNTPQPERMRP